MNHMSNVSNTNRNTKTQSSPATTTAPATTTPSAPSSPPTDSTSTDQSKGVTAGDINTAANLLGYPADRYTQIAQCFVTMNKGDPYKAADAFNFNRVVSNVTTRRFGEMAPEAVKARDAARTAFSELREANKAVQSAETTLKVVKGVGNAISAAGAAATAVEQYSESTAQTTTGKVVDAALAATLDCVTGNKHPLGMAVDAATGGKLSKTISNTSRVVTTLGEGILTNDDRGMRSFQDNALNGKYGDMMQGASIMGKWVADNKYIDSGIGWVADKIGDKYLKATDGPTRDPLAPAGKAIEESVKYWSENGVTDGLKKAWDAL